MCINRTVCPRIGGNISGKHMPTVRPMKPIAIMCIHMSYRKNISEKNTEIIDNIIPIKSNVNDSLTLSWSRKYHPYILQKLASEEPIASINCGILDYDTVIEKITDTV